MAEVFKTGMHYVIESSTDPENDVMIALDSDNTQDPGLIPNMVKKIRNEKFDIVIASRFAKGGRMEGCPFFRSVLSVGVAWLLMALIRLPGVRDYSTFYRAYRLALLKKGLDRYGDYLFKGKGFAAICAMLIKLGRLTSRIIEIPFVLRYDQKQGTSGMKIWKTMRGYFELIYEYYATKKYQSV